MSPNSHTGIQKPVPWGGRAVAVVLLILVLFGTLAAITIIRQIEFRLIDVIASSDRAPIVALYQESYMENVSNPDSDDWQAEVEMELSNVLAADITVSLQSADTDHNLTQELSNQIAGTINHSAKGIIPISDGRALVSSRALIGPSDAPKLLVIEGPITDFGPALGRTIAVVWAVIAVLVTIFITIGHVFVRTALRHSQGLDQLTQQLQEEVMFDRTTGAMSRTYFDESSEDEISRARRHDRPLGMMLVDVPDLGDIRHSQGRDAIETAMALVGGHISAQLREADTISRFASDQFIVLLPESNASSVETVSSRVVESLGTFNDSNPFEAMVFSRVNIGVSTYPESGDDIDGLIAAAEIALIWAELEEGSRLQRFDQIRSYGGKEELLVRIEARLKSAGLSTCISLANVIEESRLCCTGHQARVAELSDRIAERLGLDVFTRQTLAIAGKVHDLGMISATEEELKNYSFASSDPPESIRKHPENAVRLLNLPADLKMVGEAILAHHENYDGTGYPAGIERQQIPISARILRAADAFDHMSCSTDPVGVGQFDSESIVRSLSKMPAFDPVVIEALAKEVGKRQLAAV